MSKNTEVKKDQPGSPESTPKAEGVDLSAQVAALTASNEALTADNAALTASNEALTESEGISNLENEVLKEELAAATSALGNLVPEKQKVAEPEEVPAFYNGKVRGHFLGTRRTQQHPFDKVLRFDVAEGISNKKVGEIKSGSWLDSQLRAGVIKFVPEAD